MIAHPQDPHAELCRAQRLRADHELRDRDFCRAVMALGGMPRIDFKSGVLVGPDGEVWRGYRNVA